jgi:hypothetical protein
VSGSLTASANGALGAINSTALIDNNRLLVVHEVEQRRNGVYTLTDGDGSNPWVLTRADDMDGTPSSECAGGSVVGSLQQMMVLAGVGNQLVSYTILTNNNVMVFSAFAATVPLDVFTDSVTIGGAGVDGSIHVLRGSDDVPLITLEADTGHITAASITTPRLSGLENDMLLAQGDIGWTNSLVLAQGGFIATNTADIATNGAAIATNTADIVDNTSDANKPISAFQQVALDGLLDLGNDHAGSLLNPHSVDKSQVGLGLCDNSSDAAKSPTDRWRCRLGLSRRRAIQDRWSAAA